MTGDSDQLRSACGVAPHEPITVRDITGDTTMVWMATTIGLIQWSRLDHSLTCYRSTDSVACPTGGRLASGSLWSVARFSGEGIAVGSTQGEISILSEQALQDDSRCWQTDTLLTPIPGLLPKKVYDLARHSDGMLLAATDGGLYYQPTPSEPWQRYDIPHGTGEVIRIFDFVAGTPPCTYVGTANGLYGIQC